MLLLVAGALAAAPSAERTALWEGCTSTASGQIRSISCRSSILSASDLNAPETAASDPVAVFLAGLASSSVVAEPATAMLTIGTYSVSQRPLTMATERPYAGTASWFYPTPRSTRVVTCLAPVADADGAKRCAARTADAVQNGWPDWLPPEAGAMVPTVVGRTVDVPAGCVGSGQLYRGRVDCMALGGGLLVWTQLKAEPTAEERASIPTAMARNFEQGAPGTTYSASEARCALEGVSAECWSFAPSGGGIKRGLVGLARLYGVPIMAQCVWEGAEGTLPSPCDQLLGVVR